MSNINFKEIIKNGGATLDKNGNNIKKSNGFMVSIIGYEYTTKNEQDAQKKVLEYMEILKNDNNLYVGIWLENGIIYVDLSLWFLEKDTALEIGKKNRQLAIYDLKENKSIYLSNFDFIKYYTLYEVKKNEQGEIVDFVTLGQFDSIIKISKILKANIYSVRNSVYNSIDCTINQLIDNKLMIVSDYALKNSIE